MFSLGRVGFCGKESPSLLCLGEATGADLSLGANVPEESWGLTYKLTLLPHFLEGISPCTQLSLGLPSAEQGDRLQSPDYLA